MGYGIHETVSVPLTGFRAKMNVHIEKDNFIIKSAENDVELEQVLKLRYEVFIFELLGKKRLFGVKMDKYDHLCDHLMVIDRRSNECVATYRLISDAFSTDFYSSFMPFV